MQCWGVEVEEKTPKGNQKKKDRMEYLVRPVVFVKAQRFYNGKDLISKVLDVTRVATLKLIYFRRLLKPIH